MEKLGSYELTGHLTSQNSGYSVWGFGRKNGKDYFIKQFLSPKYPAGDGASSPERIAKVKKKCESFERKKIALYDMLNRHSDGNAVRVEEFFRIESRYYISMRKIEALPLNTEMIPRWSEEKKRFICGVIAHGISSLHRGHIVHADLKPDNILFMHTPAGGITAKIIDFDSGFLESDPPVEGEEIVGDQVYFSPEACKTFMGEHPELTCKMDIFALGVLFHQYFTGSLPEYDNCMGCCVGEALARGGSVTVSEELPEDVRELLKKMLSPDPALRPSAIEVYAMMMGKTVEYREQKAEESVPVPEVTVAPSTLSANPFYRPGNL